LCSSGDGEGGDEETEEEALAAKERRERIALGIFYHHMLSNYVVNKYANN
jgi:hypothetical protein